MGAPVKIDPSDAEQILREAARIIEEAWREVQREIARTGPAAPILAQALRAWPVLVGVLATAGAVVGVVEHEPRLAVLAGPIGVLLEELLSPHPTVARELAGRLSAALRDIRAALPGLAGAVVGLGTETMPSPAAVASAPPEVVRDALARVAVWQRAHHRLVHRPLVEEETDEAGASLAAAAALEGAAVETVHAVRTIVRHLLPEAVRELTERIRQLRQAQQQANAELAHELERTTDRLAQRIGDLVRWLTTQALPDLEEQIRAEKAARQAAISATRHQIDRATAPIAEDLVAVQAALAPLAAFGIPTLLHGAEKVRRNEDLIDELEHLDWSSLLAFTSVPALTALVTRLMPPVVEAGPRMLSALEGAAAAALGSL